MISDRIYNIEMSIIGKWQNETIAMMFDGNLDGEKYGTVYIGDPNLTVYGLSKYQIFLKEDNPYFRLINDYKGTTQIKEWIILEIDPTKGVLRFGPKDAKEISLYK